jgi:hypothetical protein
MMDLTDRAPTITFLLPDRDCRFTKAFDAVSPRTASGSSPAHPGTSSERLIGTLRRELLDRIMIVNERHLRRILTVYLDHFNEARPHRALAHLAPAQAETQPPQVINLADYQMRRRPILNGLISEYQITA